MRAPDTHTHAHARLRPVRLVSLALVALTAAVAVPAGTAGAVDPLYPSNDCATGTGVFDGFVGDTHVRLRTASPSPTTTWVCVAADDGTTHVGGKAVVEAGTPSTPEVDGDHTACADHPDNQRLRDMTLGPDEEPVVVDLAAGTDGVWLCVQATTEVAERVVVPVDTGGTTFLPDTTAPYPYVETPAPLGEPSSACQESLTGDRTRLVNVEVAGTHLWLYTWQESSSVSHACVRVEGAEAAGGRLDLDTAGGQTFATTDASDDFTPCDVPVVSDPGTPPYDVRISDPLEGPPAWACVQIDGISRRVALDTAGGQGVVAFTPDNTG